MKIQQQSCEALLLVGHMKEVGNSVLSLVDRKINMTESMKTWVSGELSSYCSFGSYLKCTVAFMEKCLSTPENNGDTNGEATRNINVPAPQRTSHASHRMIPLFRQWTRSRLTTGSWNDTLTAAAGVSTFS